MHMHNITNRYSLILDKIHIYMTYESHMKRRTQIGVTDTYSRVFFIIINILFDMLFQSKVQNESKHTYLHIHIPAVRCDQTHSNYHLEVRNFCAAAHSDHRMWYEVFTCVCVSGCVCACVYHFGNITVLCDCARRPDWFRATEQVQENTA